MHVIRVKITFLFSIFAAVMFTTANVHSRELYNRGMSVRGLGMGGAFAPLARGTDALFFNPSGLARTKEITLTALKFNVGVNGVEAYENIQNIDGNDLADTLREFYGDNIWVGGGAVSGFSTPSFAAAIYDTFNVSADLSNPALPSFEVDYVNDYGIAAGFGIDVAPGFAFGFAGKRINRMGSTEEVAISSIADLDGDELMERLDNRGLGYSLDVGAMFTVNSPVKPTFTLVMKDLGNTKFSLDAGIKNPPTDYSNLIGALSFEMEIPGITITPVLQMNHLDSDEEIHIGKKIHMGVEFALPGLDLRAGLHQGYYTAGVGLNLGILMLDVATYGVELGEYPGQQEDRRYVLELTIDFGFDPSNGVFLGLNKENRKRLKQRR
jgi:hypothetical protein